jgi:hypothetical protein
MTISRFALGAVRVVGLVAPSLAQQAPKPTIAALFSNNSSGMAFWIECRNTSGRPVESRTFNWIESYCVDGVEPPKGGRGGSGGSHPIPAGNLWRGVFTIANAMTARLSTSGADSLNDPARPETPWTSRLGGHSTR